MQGSLIRADAVRMRGVDDKAPAAIMQHDAGLFSRDADPERREKRIDHGNSHAVTVNDGDQDRVAVRRRSAGKLHAARAVDARGEIGGKAALEQGRHRGAHEGGIGDVGVTHRISEPRRLERDVQPLRVLWAERGEIKTLKNVE
jgi:hypothetical protein